MRDRNSVMRTCGTGKVNVGSKLAGVWARSSWQDFGSFAKTVMADKIKTLRNSLASSGGKAPQAQSQSTGALIDTSLDRVLMADPRGAKKAKSSNPIIMISSSPTALLTMWNIRAFLTDGV